MDDKDYSLTKETSDETIESWAGRGYIGEELRAQLVKADALIVPSEGYGDAGDLRHFPEGTEDLVSFLRRNGKGDQHIDICIEEDDYKELAQHYDLLTIAGVIATSVFAPILVNLISDYIKQRLGSRAADTTLKTSLTISDVGSGKSISLTYEGPASTYENVMLGAVKEAVREQGQLAPAAKSIGAAPDTGENDEGKRS